jgi:hypothetical protein
MVVLVGSTRRQSKMELKSFVQNSLEGVVVDIFVTQKPKHRVGVTIDRTMMALKPRHALLDLILLVWHCFQGKQLYVVKY